MYAFNAAAIFLWGHPYIESTTVLSDIYIAATPLLLNYSTAPHKMDCEFIETQKGGRALVAAG